uniref:Uncharacterized protein n=1 Tax=Ciona intestinalis TaxID=7719 RepID=H2XNA8_CIOIN
MVSVIQHIGFLKWKNFKNSLFYCCCFFWSSDESEEVSCEELSELPPLCSFSAAIFLYAISKSFKLFCCKPEKPSRITSTDCVSLLARISRTLVISSLICSHSSCGS